MFIYVHLFWTIGKNSPVISYTGYFIIGPHPNHKHEKKWRKGGSTQVIIYIIFSNSHERMQIYT